MEHIALTFQSTNEPKASIAGSQPILHCCYKRILNINLNKFHLFLNKIIMKRERKHRRDAAALSNVN